MLYFKAPDVVYNIKEGSKLPIRKFNHTSISQNNLHSFLVGNIRGVATLKLQTEIDDPFPDAFEEDPELVERNVEPELPPLPFKIKSIRRKPTLAKGPDDRLLK